MFAADLDKIAWSDITYEYIDNADTKVKFLNPNILEVFSLYLPLNRCEITRKSWLITNVKVAE